MSFSRISIAQNKNAAGLRLDFQPDPAALP
jgi:hypothetical protein